MIGSKTAPHDVKIDIRLLIVDDHRGVREALRYVFAVAGIEQLEEATTCEEALCMLDQEFDLLLLDIGLPDGNGRAFRTIPPFSSRSHPSAKAQVRLKKSAHSCSAN